MLIMYKDDAEPILQHHMPTIKTCEVKLVQYRKPGPTLPTLVLTFSNDEAADKSRRRRSSRTGALGLKDVFPNSLFFRSDPDAEYSIYDWQLALQQLIGAVSDVSTPLSPMSPSSPPFAGFKNPFSTAQKKSSSRSDRRNQISNASHTSMNTDSSNDYNASEATLSDARNALEQIITPSPSLKSRRSDLSSQASSIGRPPGYQGTFPIPRSSDLPSPVSMVGAEDQLIAGWTSAQGRSSALSNHTRGSNSVSASAAGTPPPPAQTILDRAFQMRMIPGSEKTADQEAKLSSIARFEALMRETDERIRAGKHSAKNAGKESAAPEWDLAEEDEEEEDDVDRQESTDLLEQPGDQQFNTPTLSVHQIPTQAQRALEFISGRTIDELQRPMSNRRPSSSRETPNSTSSNPPPLPRSVSTDMTGYTARAQAKRASRPLSMVLSVSSPQFEDLTPTSTNTLKRRSSNSANRLSLTGDFAKRLSSGSSLLPAQSHASDGTASSIRDYDSVAGGDYVDRDEIYTEDEYDHHNNIGASLVQGSRLSRLSALTHDVDGESENSYVPNDRKYGWRGSGFGAGAFSQEF